MPFVKELLALASGKDKDGNVLLTQKDLSNYSAKRRVDARASNPNFTLSTFHKVFGSSKCDTFLLAKFSDVLIPFCSHSSSTLLTIFGGRVDDLESILIDERLPDGWESRIRKQLGLTIGSFNSTVLKVEFGINENKYKEQLARQAAETPAESSS